MGAAGVNPVDVVHRVASISGRSARGLGRAAARRKELKRYAIPSRGITKGDINIRFLKLNGGRIKYAVFKPGDKFIVEINAVGEVVFLKAPGSVSFYDRTNEALIEKFQAIPFNFVDNKKCRFKYEIPQTYKSGTRRGERISGLIEVDVGVDFPTR